MESSITRSKKSNIILLILLYPTLSFKDVSQSKSKNTIFLLIIGSIWYCTAQTFSYGDKTRFFGSLFTSIILVFFIGWFFFYLYAVITCFLAKLMGGNGSVAETFKVLMWSFAPGIIAVAAYLICVFIYGANVIKANSSDENLWIIRIILLGIYAISICWLIIIIIKGISYIHNISLLKSSFVLVMLVGSIIVINYGIKLFFINV